MKSEMNWERDESERDEKWEEEKKKIRSEKYIKPNLAWYKWDYKQPTNQPLTDTMVTR